MLDTLISKLAVRSKISVLLATFAVPLAILAYKTIDILQDRIDEAQNEIAGAQKVSSVLESALSTREVATVFAARDQIANIIDSSGIILDPELYSFHLGKVFSEILPDIAYHVAAGVDAHTTVTDRDGHRNVLKYYSLPILFETIDQVQQSLDASRNDASGTRELLAQVIASRRGISDAILSAFEGKNDESSGKISQLEKQFSQEFIRVVNSRIADIRSDQSRAILIVSIATLLLPILSVIIVRNISARLAKLSSTASRTAETGDLTATIDDTAGDEISKVGWSFNSMTNSLRLILGKITHSVSLISSSLTEMAAVFRQQQATSSEIAATTTQIEATSKQITQVAESLSKTMEEVQRVSADSAELASGGQTSLDKMRSTMQGIIDACNGISQKLEVLNTKAAKIGDVVTTIAKVADQTNLLSLNAAIEAERAGEQGQGFAVVAREIRRLADQTAVSTLDIEQMVKEIQSAVAAGVMGMEKFSSEVRRGAGDIEGTSSQFSTIITQIQTLSPWFQSVSEGMRSQALGARQITESLTQLSTAARQTADSLIQSNASIDRLHEATVLLDQEIVKFRV